MPTNFGSGSDSDSDTDSVNIKMDDDDPRAHMARLLLQTPCGQTRQSNNHDGNPVGAAVVLLILAGLLTYLFISLANHGDSCVGCSP